MNTQSPLTDSELRIKRICASTYRSIHFAEQHVLCPLLTYNFIGPVPMINGKRRRVDERKQRANDISVSLSLSLSIWDFAPIGISFEFHVLFHAHLVIVCSFELAFVTFAENDLGNTNPPVSPVFIDQKSHSFHCARVFGGSAEELFPVNSSREEEKSCVTSFAR